jgi:hypothetical protein
LQIAFRDFGLDFQALAVIGNRAIEIAFLLMGCGPLKKCGAEIWL